MSKMIQCDQCKKLMYTDSREDKGVYISLTADDPLLVTVHFIFAENAILRNSLGWLMRRNEHEREMDALD